MSPLRLFLCLAIAGWFRAGLTNDASVPAKTPHGAGDSVDFNRDIRNVLSDTCFLCHGPDESTREAGLRLDVREEAIDMGAIVAGDAANSEIIARIRSDDPDLVMPPPETGKIIHEEQRALLARWIDEGATYDTHWAFVPPQRPNVPSTGKDPAGNAIDAFVAAKLNQRNQQPAPPADVMTIVRRLHFDLIGLPPTIETLNRFDASGSAADQREQLDQLIDELLDSPHFGERWARWWLDAARYADSSGYEKDMPRQVFFYRDWVIDAMNADYPYDQFIIDQIAGDLRPGAGQDELVATGFLRHSMTNEEGGADPEQFRVEAMFDRMDAIGKSILGMTTQCAQCHTHKYDPLSHREYYQMFAAMNDFHEACMTVFTPSQRAQRQRVLDDVATIEERLKNELVDWKPAVARWIDDVAQERPHWTVMTPTDIPYEGQKFRVLSDGSVLSESYAPTKMENDFALTTHVGTITAVRLDALTHPQLPRQGPGRSIDGTGALSEFGLTITPMDENGQPGTPVKVAFERAFSDVNPIRRDLKPQYRDREPDKDDRVVGPAHYAIDGDVKTAWTTDIGPGRSNQNRHIIFVPKSPVVIDSKAIVAFTMTQKHGGWNSDDNQNFLIGRYRFSITDSATIPKTTVDSRMESFIDDDPKAWNDDQWDLAFQAYRQTQDRWSAANEAIELRWRAHPETATQLVVQAREKPLPTYVLARGDFLSPTEPVQPDAPEFLHSMTGPRLGKPGDAPDRLRFAKWLVDRDSPTTARVIVNRLWQAYFGRGLVKTPEDFGFQSSPPSHPALLDYLSVELMDSGWSLQHIHRLIVTSATYRQSSITDASSYQDDPDNQWLSRGPRFRLEAEMVRDTALAASGLLNPRIGGPSVYPPAPEFLFLPPTSYGPKVWNTNQSGDEYRRSLYVHQYRSVPYPPLQVFDAPKGDAACIRRQRSNTPLQALVMLNETQFVDAARAMAARVMREIPGDDPTHRQHVDAQRIDHVFRLCTSRLPNDNERSILRTLLGQCRSETTSTAGTTDQQSRDAQLQRLLGVSPRGLRQLTGLDAEELAAWMTVCRAVLNLDETITKS